MFLEVPPFQDGNGRLRRVLTTLLLLRAGYAYAPYSSLESVIEQTKEACYLAPRQTQGTIRIDAPNWQPWLEFFLRSLTEQVQRLQSVPVRRRCPSPLNAESVFQSRQYREVFRAPRGLLARDDPRERQHRHVDPADADVKRPAGLLAKRAKSVHVDDEIEQLGARPRKEGRRPCSRRDVTRAGFPERLEETGAREVGHPEIDILRDGRCALEHGSGEPDHEEIDSLVHERLEQGRFLIAEQRWRVHEEVLG